MHTTTSRPRLGPPFWRLWASSTASNLGDGLLLAAAPLLAAGLTDDPLELGLVTASATLPWVLFGLPAGVLVDRTDRRRLLVGADIARAVAVAGLAVAVATDTASLGLLAATLFALGVAETIFDTAAQAVLPALVPPAALEAANGRLFSAQLLANGVAGPPLGAAAFALVAPLPFAVDAVTFGISGALLRTLALPGVTPERRRSSARRELLEGLAWLWRHAGVRAFAVGAAAVNVAFAGANTMLVLLARDQLGVDGLGFALLLTAAAAGGVAGGLAASRLSATFGSVGCVALATILFSGGLAVTGAAASAVLAAAGWAAFSFGGEVWNVVAVAYRQRAVPHDLLGRVMASYRFIAYGAFPVGGALGGLVASAAGIRATFVAGAVLTAALAAYLIPALRRAT